MINSFDIETINDEKSEKLVPYCISAIIYEKRYIFFGIKCVDEFLDFCFKITIIKKNQKKKKNLLLFSHNLTFDGSVLLQYISSSKNYSYDGLFVKGVIYSLSIYNKGVKIKFQCSYKFFPSRLESASKLLKTRNKIDFDHKEINIDNFKEKKEMIIKYCINDSEIVKEIIEKYDIILSKYIKNWMTYTYSITAASYNIFKEKFNKNKILLKTSIKEDEIMRQAYFGGRCEVFGNPKEDEKIYHFDFSGMYAQVMREEFCYGKFKINKNIKKINKEGFYYIKFYSNNEIPILPVHSMINNKLMFVNGEGEGLYWWEEIKLFENNGGVVLKIIYSIEFDNKGNIFKDFVECFTEERKKSDESNSIAKLIINSLYGRLGMNSVTEETKILNKEEYSLYKKKNEELIISELKVNNIYILNIKKEINEEELINSNVALAAMITSKARIKLYKGFISTIENGGRVLYCDTDSIFASFKKNVDNCRHGEIVWDTSKNDTKIKNAIFAMPKAYAVEYEDGREIVKIKGINRTAISMKEFRELFIGQSEKKIILSILKKKNYVITPNDMEKVVNLQKYDKRAWIPKTNKTETRPFVQKDNIYV